MDLRPRRSRRSADHGVAATRQTVASGCMEPEKRRYSAHPVLRQERRSAPEGAIVAQVSGSESEDFAGRFSLALRASNLSRSQLSATLGVHKSLVSRWLSGQVTPTSYNLARISAVFAKLKPGFNMILWT